MRAVGLGLLVLLGPTLAGCLSPAAEEVLPASLPLSAFDVTGDFSRTLLAGVLPTLPVELVALPSFDAAPLSMGIWRPDTAERVPVIVDAGPYYANGDRPVDEPADRLGRFLIENFVPHGYAVVQASVRGTGWSGGCGDFMGLAEQRDLDALVTYLGEAEWSNGAVALIGRSYDGSTPWEAAQFGNPYLKTIVPISGLTDVGDLYYHNGSSEARAPVLGSAYWTYLLTAEGKEPGDAVPALGAVRACVDGNPAQHTVWGTAGSVNGGARTIALDLEYWRVRDFRPAVAANYRGSVFAIHGLQDWNVEPSMIVPWFNDLDVEKKLWLGQWGHMYPDRPDEHEHLRWDWAETLLRWFDRYLKGLDVATGPVVEVEDDSGKWRTEREWPPLDAAMRTFQLSFDGTLVDAEPEPGESRLFQPAANVLVDGVAAPETLGPRELVWESAPLLETTRLSGLPQLHVAVRPTTPGGHLFALLYDTDGNDTRIVGHAQMDLRYHAGGKDPRPVVPREPIVVAMEFFPLDAVIPAGHSVRLVLTQEVGFEPIPSPLSGPVDVLMGPDTPSVLRLPVVERSPAPTPWDHVHTEDNTQRYSPDDG